MPNDACSDVFHHLDADFGSSYPKVQANKIVNIRSMMCWRIQSSGADPAMAHPHHDQGSFTEDFLDHLPEELIAQPNNSFNPLSSFVAATEASMRFSAVLPLGGSTIASSCQPIPSSNSNSNSSNITSITDTTSVENTGLVDESSIVEGVISLAG